MSLARLFVLLALLSLGTVETLAQEQAQLPPQASPQEQPPQPGEYVPWRYRQQQQAPTPIRLPVSPAVAANFFVGRWGQVAFNNENDLPKMRGVAKGYCGSVATSITQRTPETFAMYVMTDLKEVQVYEQNGSLYIIPVEQVSDGVIRGARELHVLDDNAFTLRYLEDEAHRRYGPNVFVRCGTKSMGKLRGDETPQQPAKKKKKAKKQKAAEEQQQQ